MPSFDVVSKADMQEVRNAVDQVSREIANRFDFKGSKSEVKLENDTVVIMADDNMKLKALQGLLKEKLSKRGVNIRLAEFQEPQSAGGDMIRQIVKIKQGLNQEELKKMNKSIKATKMKVQAQIQGDQLRVSGKKKDDLQSVIGLLKEQYNTLALEFVNFRD
ncbi:MAG: YajQ family cyclic di-GMP-binding protein [Candidatus Dadabacteria bacterium]|nr:MAG: YajQ family cyclic di-GMP-binding protein [Candidatus Dadabacteria bacterium]